MTHVVPDEETILHPAPQIAARAAPVAYLAQTCAGDDALRSRVEALLDAHDHQRSFLQSPAVVHAHQTLPPLEPPNLLLPLGTVIGRYKILEAIGEGGYDTVFMAE